MRMFYVAHPYKADRANLDRARRWVAVLQDAFPGCAFIAPWIVDCMSLEETPALRARGFEYNREVIARCDVYLMCGGEVSEGVARERDVAISEDLDVVDLNHLGPEPPEPAELQARVIL